MCNVQKALIGVFLTGVLLAGLGTGIALGEFSSLSYGGKVIIGEEDLVTKEMDFEMPMDGKTVILAYQGYQDNWKGNLIEDPAVPEGIIRFQVTYNEKVVDPYLYYNEYELEALTEERQEASEATPGESLEAESREPAEAVSGEVPGKSTEAAEEISGESTEVEEEISGESTEVEEETSKESSEAAEEPAGAAPEAEFGESVKAAAEEPEKESRDGADGTDGTDNENYESQEPAYAGELYLVMNYKRDEFQFFMENKDKVLEDLKNKSLSSYEIPYITEVIVRVNPETKDYVKDTLFVSWN